MAYSREDIAKLEAAMATGAMKVRFADNREVFYRSLAEMRSQLATMKREVLGASSGQPTRFAAGFRSNLY